MRIDKAKFTWGGDTNAPTISTTGTSNPQIVRSWEHKTVQVSLASGVFSASIDVRGRLFDDMPMETLHTFTGPGIYEFDAAVDAVELVVTAWTSGEIIGAVSGYVIPD